MSPEPLVSILMTAYNREAFIAEAIESVLSSTYSNFELIIVDDCSNDKTVEISKHYVPMDERVQLYINENNLGDYPNRNKAVGLAKGKYIMFCDSDDLFFPFTIAYCVDAMEQNMDCKFGIYYAGIERPIFKLTSKEIIKQHFFKEPILTMGPGGTIIERDFFKEVKGYPEKYGPANDMYFNLKAAANTTVLLFPKLFLHYRIHEGQEKNNQFAYLYNNYNYLEDAMAEVTLPLDKRQQSLILKKNKRRFLVNTTRFFFKTFDLKKTKEAICKTKYTLKDAFIGVFQK